MLKRFITLFYIFSFVSAEAFAQDQIADIPNNLTTEEVLAASIGCKDCHSKNDAPSMHENPAVQIGCVNCHGGNANIRAEQLKAGSKEYEAAKKASHIHPSHPENWPSSANTERSYTNLLKESADFVRFINPSDLRVAPQTCGSCHSKTTDAVRKSLMTTSAMLWGGASYNNNILSYKKYILGESYNLSGEPTTIEANKEYTPEEKAKGALDILRPLPQWEVVPPGDNFRIFERGGLFIKTQFAETGLPNPLEDPGKPDVRQSNRGPGTGSRISVPVLNIHKTRLNDPHLSLMGTNDHPGDYRHSGCASCHVIYGNDREEKHSGPFAKFGNEGKTQTEDPTIDKNESGHPLYHKFTRSVPTSQCMVCHMHQPNMFVNSFLGYTMWDYESDAPKMWPKEQKDPTDEELFKSLEHNPEEAAARGLWSDKNFLQRVSKLNDKLKDTQFADYHGHGWNFRAVFKRDRKGNLLDKEDKMVSSDDPQKFKKAVHLADIHLEKGMHCGDCHFSGDSHGNGNIYGEVAQAVEIQCQDCHGDVKEKSNLKTSGPAAPKGGTDLSIMRTPFGKLRFEWLNGKLIQRSNLYANLEWEIKQVKDIINPQNPEYNEKAARAKTIEKFDSNDSHERSGNLEKIAKSNDLGKILAHADSKMSCFSCHSSWVTSCAGCHLPIQANWKQKSKHFDGKETRNWASYNPQVARDEMFQLGLHGSAKDFKIVPIRSSSALVLSSTDANRQKIYIQQPPTAASGHSSQAFAPHFPHTVRTTETKTCVDCHVSKENDNNAILSQLFLLGTNFVNFMGYNTWVAEASSGLEAVVVTEWSEPQAVIGSYLQKYAYPKNFEDHQKKEQELVEAHHHGVEKGSVNTIQLRGEYLYTTAGSGGFRVYDVANIANKGFSERIVTSPVSPLGQNTFVSSKNATSFALPTTMPIAPFRKQAEENQEKPLHKIYHYAFIADAEEGLIVVNVDTLADAEPRNNFLERALTWNENGILNGAKYITLAGYYAYICTDKQLVILNLDNPLDPKIVKQFDFYNPKAVAIQFRYAFVVDGDGLKVIDITKVEDAKLVSSATLKLNDARNIYLARTYAYIAGGRDGLIIADIEKPEKPRIYQIFNAENSINDLNDVKVATTNASLFAYLADGKNGLKILQLTDPERVPEFYGFSPEVKPKLIARRKTRGPAMAISKPLDRDRAVDETGNQVSVFGRIGSRPFNLEEMRRFFLKENGEIFKVK